MRLGKTAVVLGGSAAGLCAAGALAPYFDQVLVLERDELPGGGRAPPRRAAEQAPALPAELRPTRDRGAVPRLRGRPHRRRRPAPDAVHGRRLPRRGGLVGPQAQRDDDGLQLADPHRARAARQGARAGQRRRSARGHGDRPDHARRRGHRRRHVDGEHIDADFVVDAMGRGSSVSGWLVAAGWPEPEVRTLDAKVTYTSRWYDLPGAAAAASWWWQHLVIMPTPDKGEHPAEHEFLVNFFPIEGNRVIACMGSWGLDDAAHHRRVRRVGRAGCGRRCSPPRWTACEPDLGGPPDPLDRQQVATLRPPAHARRRAWCSSATRSARSTRSTPRASAPRRARRCCCATTSPAPNGSTRLLREVPCRRNASCSACPGAWRWPGTRATNARRAPRSRPSGNAAILAAVSGPAFSLIVGAAREDDVVDEHFAKVFNLDESLGDMLRNPRVIAGLRALPRPRGTGPAPGAVRLRRRRPSRPATDYSPAHRGGT